MSAEDRTGSTLVVEIDQHELACRIVEALVEHKRPAGATAKEALAQVDPDMLAAVQRAALASAMYLRDVMTNSRTVAELHVQTGPLQ